MTDPEPNHEKLGVISSRLKELSIGGMETLKRLFWEDLNYSRISRALSPRGLGEASRKTLAEEPLLFAAAGDNASFQVIYLRLKNAKLLRTEERPLVNDLRKSHPHALFIFSTAKQDRWHLLNVKYDQDEKKRRLFRRIAIGPEERLRTAAERVAMLDVATISPDLFGLSPLAIQARHDDAFDVEQVTKLFFEKYKGVYNELDAELKRQTKDAVWAHDYALKFLNRLMFIYFVQRKRWLGEQTEFIDGFWKAYQDSGSEKNTFYPDWLKVLFFEAFNRRNIKPRKYFPDEINRVLAAAPYLNGGLFEFQDADRLHDFTISDDLFGRLFHFLDRYNFTIAEDSPIDQEVAVDPEMLGKVYESLINLDESDDDRRGEAGIFYTPRTEIDLMCRLALTDNLANHLGDKYRALLYEVVMALEPDEKLTADEKAAKQGLWPELAKRLEKVTVLDPACGSGSFLVGMLHILDDLSARGAQALGKTRVDAYERRKQIIERSLYGVDVKEWAGAVAELRLWLALIIDAEFTPRELAQRGEPLLPNFTFKIRSGDSLVQEIAGIDLRTLREMPAAMKPRFEAFAREKGKFYRNAATAAYKSKGEVENAEIGLFRELLRRRADELGELAKKKMRRQAEIRGAEQLTVFGGSERPPNLDDAFLDDLEVEIGELKKQEEQVRLIADEVKAAKKVPFVWSLAFVERFTGKDKGFDIVVGNPPYVRQEMISDPLVTEKPTADQKKAYKEKLMRSVFDCHPGYYTGAAKLNAKSDLYVYFYFVGLSLLNPSGSFCFITSNSWLDVGYGAELQEFLLRQCRVRMILDNRKKRSFASAEVNTAIALLSAPIDERDAGLAAAARFVMFDAPFEHIVSPVIFQEIEEAKPGRSKRADYALFVIGQEALLEDGCAAAVVDDDAVELEDAERGKLADTKAVYAGNKWGGKYLRAPEIYWKILEKSKGKMVRLGDVATVKRGITTGANEFFYLDAAKIREWGIEKRFTRPVIKTPRDYYGIVIPGSDLKLFWCQEEKKALKGTGAADYIAWGEKQGFHKVPSCRSRNRWYSLHGLGKPVLLWPRTIFERHIVYECPEDYLAVDRFYTISGSLPVSLRAYLNSSIVSLFIEVEGCQVNHGGIDVIKEWAENLPALVSASDAEIERVYRKIAKREIGLCADELEKSDRRELNRILLDRLGLSGEKVLDELNAAVKAYVAGRIHKSGRETTQQVRSGNGATSDE